MRLERAAEVLGGLMECYIVNKQYSKANRLHELYRNEKYNNYPAFRREVDNVVKNSNLIKI